MEQEPTESKPVPEVPQKRWPLGAEPMIRVPVTEGIIISASIQQESVDPADFLEPGEVRALMADLLEVIPVSFQRFGETQKSVGEIVERAMIKFAPSK